MGTGAKLDPTKFRICDISKTHTCPLAKVMRLKLRENGINHCDVLFSDELPVKALTASELEGKTVRDVPGLDILRSVGRRAHYRGRGRAQALRGGGDR